MPSIAKVEAADPPVEPAPDWRDYPSPDGAWVAAFHDPYELHMGLNGWQLSLLWAADGSDQTPPAIGEISERNEWLCPQVYQPWRSDSQMLALLYWHYALWLYDLPTAEFIPCDLERSPLVAQWSPSLPVVLAVGWEKLCLIDTAGACIAEVDWKFDTTSLPFTGWTPDGEHFFVLGRASREAKTRLTFFRADAASPAGHLSLDTDEMVPYDADQYAHLRRDTYTLITGPATRSAGALLDTWDRVTYDPLENRLLLSVYRPISEPYTQHGEPVCEAQPVWVAVTLS